MNQKEFAEKTGLSPATVSRKVSEGIVVVVDGEIDYDVSVKNIISYMARPHEYGSSRMKYPISLDINTIVAIENEAKKRNIPPGRAAELMLFESKTFNDNL